jgi:hypothetical protein
MAVAVALTNKPVALVQYIMGSNTPVVALEESAVLAEPVVAEARMEMDITTEPLVVVPMVQLHPGADFKGSLSSLTKCSHGRPLDNGGSTTQPNPSRSGWGGTCRVGWSIPPRRSS